MLETGSRGFPDNLRDLKPGDHLCCFYETGEEHRAVLTSFLSRGLERGEKVVCFVDSYTAEVLLDYLTGKGIHVDAYLERGQLSILGGNQTYLKGGAFHPDRMIALLRAETERALSEGYSALRVTGEMTWVLRGLPGSERLIEYEARLNDFFPGSQCLAICQYHRSSFHPGLLLDVLRTHPLVIIGQQVYDNFYYIPPAELLGEGREVAELNRWLEALETRKQAEDKLKEREKFLSAILESVQDGISVLNKDLTILHTNSVMKKWYAKHLPLEGKPCYVCYRDASEPCHPCPSIRCMKTGKVEMEIVPGPPESAVKWIELYSYPMKDPLSGKVTGVVEFVRDVTARREAEAERDRLAVAIEQAGEAIVITDPQGMIQYVNPAFEAITGYSRGEAVGQNPRILKSGKQDEAFYKELWGTITSGRTWKGRFVNRRKDGTLYTEEATISPVMDPWGNIVNFVAVKRDITEHLETSKEKALLQEQLYQAQKLESVGRLAGGIAHDFNNMLNIIIGYGEIILQKLYPWDPLKEDVEKILDAGRRAATLTRQLLAFSRRQALRPEVVNLNDHLRGMRDMLRRLIGEDIDLQLILAEELASVFIDPGQFDQVIMNLAVNARDAMPRGGRLIIETANVRLGEDYARRHQGVEPGDYVLVAVTDTGCGMDRETMSRVFEPFFTTKGEERGTGLGLSVAYGIIKQSHGHIWVYSEPGQGTTFKVYLPQVMEVPGGREVPTEVKDTVVGEGLTVLVVEDEEALRELINEMLKRLGFEVVTAANGGEALLLVEEKGVRPHLVITDVVLPGVSGDVLVNRLKKRLSDLKVLYMSGYTDNAIVHHGVLKPGTPFIQKPFSFEELAGKIRAVLHGW